MSDLRWKFQRDAAASAARRLAKFGVRIGRAAPPPPVRPDPVAAITEAAARCVVAIDDRCFPSGYPSGECPGYLYAVRQVDGGPVKIGKAIDPVARMGEIQRMNPRPLMLVGLSHHQIEESWLHRRNRRRRLHGEWFDIDENPLPLVGDLCFVCDANSKRRQP